MDRNVIAALVIAILILLVAASYILTRPGAPLETTPTPTVTTPTPTPTPTPTTPIYTPPTLPPTPALPEKIVIGFTVSLSGRYAEEGTMGYYGILAMVDWINNIYGGVHIGGKKIPIEIKYYDDQSSKDLVVSLYERLITADKVHFLLGPYSSPLVFAAAPVAEKHKMVLVNWGGASDLINQQGYKYVVTIWTQASGYQASVVEMLAKIGPTVKKIAILYAEDEFNRMVAKGAKEVAEKLGLTVVYYKGFPPGITDFGPMLPGLKAAEPDAIIAGTHYANGLLLAKQLAEARIDAKLISLTVAPCIPEFYRALGTLAEGVICPSQWEPGVKYKPDFGPTPQEFHIAYLAKRGAPPSYHGASAAAALLLLVKAIEIAQSLDQDAVREAFNKMELTTFFGEFKIDPQTGYQLGHKMVLGQWQGGIFKVVWPSEIAESKLYYPIPTWSEKIAGKKAVP